MLATDAREALNRLSLWDYLVIVLMLVMSAAIGVYFGYADRRKGTKEFLTAGKSMGIFPVAMSQIVSYISAVALLGIPSEVYQNGIIYILIVFSCLIGTIVTSLMYLPVFWDLQATSVYHYLEKRFSVAVRILGSTLYIIQMLLYMAVVTYAPALALSQVTGIGLYVSVSSISLVCIFYTTLGGIKAVLWTDVVQIVVIFGSMVFVIINGIMIEGGIHRVWQVGSQGNRTELANWDFDPRTRHTVFSIIVGFYCIWLSLYGVSQAQIQRYLCLRNKSSVIKALVMNAIGWLFLNSLMAVGGLLLYKKYVDCDPVSSGVVEQPDQLLPFYVMETYGNLKGLPGLFVAGVFAGSLSTVSSGINSLAAITLEDFVKLKWPDISDKRATKISRVLSLIYGLITFVLIFVIEMLGDLLQASLGITGLIGGPLLGVFTLGMFFPWANAKGAFIGTVVALALNLWIGIGAQIATKNGEIIGEKYPLNTCDIVVVNGSFTVENSRPVEHNIVQAAETGDIFLEFYKLSYLLYATLGSIVAILVGMMISAVTGFQNIRQLNPKLLSPAVSWVKWIIPGYHLIGIDIPNYHRSALGSEMKLPPGISRQNNGKMGKQDEINN